MLTKVVRPVAEKRIRLVPEIRVIRCKHTCSTGAAHHQTELNTLLDILLATNLDLPGTSTGMQLAWEALREGGKLPIKGECTYRIEG